VSDPTPAFDPPGWVAELTPPGRILGSDAERMRLAIELARDNVRRRTGGPFGAIVCEEASGRIVAAGVNSVERLRNSVLHAEVAALIAAEARIGSWTLRREGGPGHVLVSSCDLCAMCLGAALWSGVTRIVCGATRDDAAAAGFEEGPVFAESWGYLVDRGIAVSRGVMAGEARGVFDLYRERGGLIYNG
jgi:tRNA(Arg) A34 adenosine deaminase TadA